MKKSLLALGLFFLSAPAVAFEYKCTNISPLFLPLKIEGTTVAMGDKQLDPGGVHDRSVQPHGRGGHVYTSWSGFYVALIRLPDKAFRGQNFLMNVKNVMVAQAGGETNFVSKCQLIK